MYNDNTSTQDLRAKSWLAVWGGVACFVLAVLTLLTLGWTATLFSAVALIVGALFLFGGLGGLRENKRG